MKRIAKFFLVLIIMGIIAVSIESAHRVKRITGHLQPTATPAPSSATPSDVRATREHLRTELMNDEIKKEFGPFITKHKHLIETIVQREEDYERDYYVLYNAHNNTIRALQDFLYLLHQREYKTKLPDDFIFLRWWHNRPVEKDVQSWLDNHFSIRSPHPFDHDPKIYDALLSVNFSLFGNFSVEGSSTFNYFIENKSFSIDSPDNTILLSLLQNIMQHYGFNPKYARALLGYGQEIRADSGTLLQIFIPRQAKQPDTEKPIDQYVYLSQSGGAPIEWVYVYNYQINARKVAPDDFDKARRRYIRSSGVIQARLEQPQDFNLRTYDTMEGRLYMPAKGPLDQHGGFKIFRYIAISPDEEEAYKKKMSTLFSEMIKEKTGAYPTQVYTLPPINLEVKIGSAVQSLVNSLVGSPTSTPPSTSTSTSSSSSSSSRPASSAVPPKPAPSTPVHAAVAITPGAAAQAARSAVYHQRHQATPWWRQRLDHYYTTTLNWLKSWIK